MRREKLGEIARDRRVPNGGGANPPDRDKTSSWFARSSSKRPLPPARFSLEQMASLQPPALDYCQDLRYPASMRTIITLLASLALTHAGELHQAARVCDADRMRQLLSRHQSLNETDESGMTPLHIAIDSRQPERMCVAADRCRRGS